MGRQFLPHEAIAGARDKINNGDSPWLVAGPERLVGVVGKRGGPPRVVLTAPLVVPALHADRYPRIRGTSHVASHS